MQCTRTRVEAMVPSSLPQVSPPPCFAPSSRQLAAVTLHLSRTPPPKKKKSDGGKEGGAAQSEEFRLTQNDRERKERNEQYRKRVSFWIILIGEAW